MAEDGDKCCYPPPWYARDAKYFLTGWVWFGREYFLLPKLQLPSFIIMPQTFFFFDTWSCYVAQIGLECSSRSGLSLQRAGNRSTDVQQHFWLGPQFVEISGIHFSSPGGCIWIEQMFVRCDHPEWSLPCSEPMISVPSRARFLSAWWPLVIKCFLPLSLVCFLWHQRENRERLLWEWSQLSATIP